MPTCSPCLGWLVIKYWKQKDVGVQLSAAYLADWAFAMPFYQDKQLSQPTPAYYNRCMQQRARDGSGFQAYRYNTPYVNASLRLSSDRIQFAKLSQQKITYRERPFVLRMWLQGYENPCVRQRRSTCPIRFDPTAHTKQTDWIGCKVKKIILNFQILRKKQYTSSRPGVHIKLPLGAESGPLSQHKCQYVCCFNTKFAHGTPIDVVGNAHQYIMKIRRTSDTSYTWYW